MEHKNLLPNDFYKVGDIVSFTVVKPYNNYCELLDEKTGIVTFLQGTKDVIIVRGQIVRCRILAVTEKHPKVLLIENSSLADGRNNCLTEALLADYAERKELTWSTRELARILTSEGDENSYEELCYQWIQLLIYRNTDLCRVRLDCMDMLEKSDLLDGYEENLRFHYQTLLTMIIEHIGYYVRALELVNSVNNENAECFVNTLLEKLEKSGYLYHPTKQFNILSIIFLLRPDMINDRMKDLIDIVCRRDIRAWSKNPFRKSLIKVMEQYYNSYGRKANRQREDSLVKENCIKSLAIQYLLLHQGDSNEVVDERLSLSRLFLASSLGNQADAMKLANLAFYTLFSSDRKKVNYSLNHISSGLVRYLLCNESCPTAIGTINTYSHSRGKLVVSDNGVELFSDGNKKGCVPVLPANLRLWKNLQIYLDEKPHTVLTTNKKNDIVPYIHLWNEIEQLFFNSQSKSIEKKPVKKITHYEDDEVIISFTCQDIDNPMKFYCKIEDGSEAEGYITIDDIVAYSVLVNMTYFMSKNGNRYKFRATIVDIDEDGFIHFSMKKLINDAIKEDGGYSYDENFVCSLGVACDGKQTIPAVSSDGFSVRIQNANLFAGLEKNATVICKQNCVASDDNYHVNANIIEARTEEFSVTAAFKCLMGCYAEGEIDNVSEEHNDDMLQTDTMMDEAYVRQLIMLIDRMAKADNDYVNSYNYLGYARLLSMLIGWESQVAYYRGRMDIIAKLHKFAMDSLLEDSEIEELENANSELFSNNDLIKHRFKQLQIVSWLGKERHNRDLYQVAEENGELKELAMLALSYNTVKRSGIESAATDVQNKIKQMLSLKGYESGLKVYADGIESDTVEFKMSLLIPAKAFTPNPEKQTEVIMRVINSFMNSKGGTLYVGVNDSGYGEGVAMDLSQAPFNGDRDKYKRCVRDNVAARWGKVVMAEAIESVEFDAENKNKDVLVVKIKPIAGGVEWEKECYCMRIGNEIRKYTKEEYQRICKQIIPVKPKETAPAEPVEKKQKPAAAPARPTVQEKIPTSAIRKNVLMPHEENYVEPVAFFRLNNPSDFVMLSEYDYDETAPLTLTVLDDEQNGWLVIGYENGFVAKVSVAELLNNNANSVYKRYALSKPIFVSIAKPDDAILTISRDKTRKQFMRVDTLDQFEQCKLQDCGENVYNEGLGAAVASYEVVPAEYVDDCDVVLNKPKTTSGYQLNDRTKPMVNKLRLIGVEGI